jgi:hypothetical protein
MGRFETRWLAARENLSALADLSGQWIDLVHGRRPPGGIVLDMDSSVSPTRRAGAESLERPLRLHPLSPAVRLQPVRRSGTMLTSSWQRRQRRRMGRCAHASCGTISRQGFAHLFPGGCGVYNARGLRVSRSRADQICDPPAGQPNSPSEHQLLTQASGRTTAK